MAGSWVALFSGGKDSAWALHRALTTGRSVEQLVTVHPPDDSYLYHVPATHLAVLAAESIGLPLREIRLPAGAIDQDMTAGARGDAELEPVETALEQLREELSGLSGVVAGAVESEFQETRLRSMCDRLDTTLCAPLWGRDHGPLLREMLAAGFEIRIVQVAARGLDRTWLGRRLDEEAVTELQHLQERYGVHVLGEGGEYETLVVDGPHMARRIELSFETSWDDSRGRGTLDITDAWLA